MVNKWIAETPANRDSSMLVSGFSATTSAAEK